MVVTLCNALIEIVPSFARVIFCFRIFFSLIVFLFYKTRVKAYSSLLFVLWTRKRRIYSFSHRYDSSNVVTTYLWFSSDASLFPTLNSFYINFKTEPNRNIKYYFTEKLKENQIISIKYS